MPEGASNAKRGDAPGATVGVGVPMAVRAQARLRENMPEIAERNQRLGVILREARKYKGKTSAQCAELLGVSRSRYSEMEAGKALISFAEFDILMERLGVSGEWLTPRLLGRARITNIGLGVSPTEASAEGASPSASGEGLREGGRTHKGRSPQPEAVAKERPDPSSGRPNSAAVRSGVAVPPLMVAPGQTVEVEVYDAEPGDGWRGRYVYRDTSNADAEGA